MMVYEEIEEIKREYDKLNFKLSFMSQDTSYEEFVSECEYLRKLSEILSIAGYTYVGSLMYGEWI